MVKCKNCKYFKAGLCLWHNVRVAGDSTGRAKCPKNKLPEPEKKIVLKKPLRVPTMADYRRMFEC